MPPRGPFKTGKSGKHPPSHLSERNKRSRIEEKTHDRKRNSFATSTLIHRDVRANTPSTPSCHTNERIYHSLGYYSYPIN